MNKSLRKLWKNARALSPVVASIILIAVTVAVSVAVAAWMGGMTVGFMGSTSVTITNVQFNGGSAVNDNMIDLTLKNTGTKSVVIAQAKVNNAVFTITSTSLDPGDADVALSIVMGTTPWVDGNPYKVDLFDSSGQVVSSYQANAPGA